MKVIDLDSAFALYENWAFKMDFARFCQELRRKNYRIV
jgi:hypothetical protein